MKKYLLFSATVIGCVLLIEGCSKSNDNGDNQLSSTDSAFAVKAAQGNIAEIEAGQVSETNAGMDSVKMFGMMMITDHGSANKSLDSIGSILSLQLPSETDAAHVAAKMHLMALTGTAFDSAYVSAQVTDHVATLALLTGEMNTGSNVRLKAYANRVYPIVQMHLAMAQALQGELQH